VSCTYFRINFSFALMNFNYSYRALLITTLLLGILFLAFKSITLSKYEVVNEDIYDLKYSEEEDLALIPKQSMKVETNRAFNEAEKFITEVESERQETSENPNEKEINSVVTEIDPSNNGTGNYSSKKNISKVKENISNTIIKENIISASTASKKNSTVSYRLVGRTSLVLPNPVYICDGFGKVIINIEVSETGRVIKTTYNASSSTTTNQCLIDSALEYASEAQFTTASNKTKQLGTVTYNFPGQQ